MNIIIQSDVCGLGQDATDEHLDQFENMLEQNLQRGIPGATIYFERCGGITRDRVESNDTDLEDEEILEMVNRISAETFNEWNS